MNLIYSIYNWLTSREKSTPVIRQGLWYAQLMKYNGPDRAPTLDTKRSQLFTSRQHLLAEMRHKIGAAIEPVTPHDSANPPDEVLYRWYDTEEWIDTWQYFWIKRYTESYDRN